MAAFAGDALLENTDDVNETSDAGDRPTWVYVVVGLAVGALLTLTVVMVVLVVVDGGDDGSSRAGDLARASESFDPTEALRLLEEALDATAGDDPAWAAETEATVLDLIAQESPLDGAESVDVTCGSELCRVTAVLGGAAAGDPAAEGFLISLNQVLSPLLSRSVAEIENVAPDRVRFTVYLARAGYYLPTEGGGLID